ncbi:Golgi-associated plant pathogenesis-related protein 1-like [Ruditapes philippinarum]|uniref:Golgi-associated plant pathogenesis-related protein 1-like n=1 Tax=Ruditapes philippinarum TaxID=129788 RepID=UPI00295BCB35|nr:Golgi-associated plant pathogenesis-related protein 1-like [Ruditapes philippinarum]
MHGVGKVRGNKKISRFAQQWANYLNDNSKFGHRPKASQKYGENLSWMSGNVNGADHVNNLYTAEEQFYRDYNYYGIEPPMVNFTHYGHFTQIVWKGSKKIGVGVAGPVVVINYDPAGNYIGQFKDNVFDKP